MYALLINIDATFSHSNFQFANGALFS